MQTLQHLKQREEDKISVVIDRVLTQIFGKEATKLIYKHLEHNYSLRREELAERIDVFAEGLEEFLSSGAYVVELKILEDIRSDYGSLCKLESESPSFGYHFVDQIRSLSGKA